MILLGRRWLHAVKAQEREMKPSLNISSPDGGPEQDHLAIVSTDQRGEIPLMLGEPAFRGAAYEHLSAGTLNRHAGCER